MHKPCLIIHSRFSWLGQCLFTYVWLIQSCTVHVFTSASSCLSILTHLRPEYTLGGPYSKVPTLFTPTSISASEINHQKLQAWQTCRAVHYFAACWEGSVEFSVFSKTSCAHQASVANIRLDSFLFSSGRWQLRGWPNPLNLPFSSAWWSNSCPFSTLFVRPSMTWSN